MFDFERSECVCVRVGRFLKERMGFSAANRSLRMRGSKIWFGQILPGAFAESVRDAVTVRGLFASSFGDWREGETF